MRWYRCHRHLASGLIGVRPLSLWPIVCGSVAWRKQQLSVLRSPCALWLCGSEQVRMQLAPIEEECLWKWVQQVNGFQSRYFSTFLRKCVGENASYLENIYSKILANHCSRSRFRLYQRKPGICTETKLVMAFIYRIVWCGADIVKIWTVVNIHMYLWPIAHKCVYKQFHTIKLDFDYSKTKKI